MSRVNLETHWGRVSYHDTEKKMTEYQIIVKYSYHKLMSNIFLMAVGCLTVSRELNLLCFNLFLRFQVCIYFMVRDSKTCYQKLLNFITEVYTLKTDNFFTSCPKRSNSGERREMENGRGKNVPIKCFIRQENFLFGLDHLLATTNLTTAH